MTLNRKIIPPGLRNNPNRDLASVDFITIHTTGNHSPTAGARNHALYIFNGSGGGQVSWHFTVDATEIWQHMEEHQRAWHAGDGTNGPGNATSIGIEIAVNDRVGFRQACLNAAWLTADLLRRHDLGTGSVVQHFRWNGKDCPHELRSGAWGVTWDDFLAMVAECLALSEPEPDTSQEPSTWAQDAWAWAISAGITDGTNPQGLITREQVVTMLARFSRL
jgi:N-acetylmuramoyl-L-alanine amidase